MKRKDSSQHYTLIGTMLSREPATSVRFVFTLLTVLLLASLYVYLRFEPPTSTTPPNQMQSAKKTRLYQLMNDDLRCILERSNNSCSFPLLTDYHQRCGRFPHSTSWTNITKGYPKSIMSSDICKLSPVTAAPQRLRQYIIERNITSIVSFGDSQGYRYSRALLDLFTKSSFTCKRVKSEPAGLLVHLNYFTQGSRFANQQVERTCKSCNSYLYVCSDKKGHRVELEYLSMIITERTQLHLNGSECYKNQTKHPLCQSSTITQYVFQHYLNKQGGYPQLLLIFSGFAHDKDRPLANIYNELQWIYGVITAHVPESSTVIWYTAPSYHASKVKEWSTSEGKGYNPHQKMQAENRFLATLQIEHHRSGKSPPMYSFFDLYHMQEQLREKWSTDFVHSNPSWYQYVVRHTANMLPSLPVLRRQITSVDHL